jgi:hypothetical protein
MDINFFLLCRKKYNKIIENLDTIIESFQDIIELNELSNPVFNLEINKNYFLEKKYEINYLKEECDKYIFNNCKHDFVIDLIDIDPDTSKNICYCKICEYCE